METDDSVVISQGPCPSCPSSDAYTTYSDSHCFCFSCGHYEKGDSSQASQLPTYHTSKMVNYTGDFAMLRSRNITEET